MAQFQQFSPKHTKLVRVMPNVNATVLAAASAYCMSHLCGKQEQTITEQIFSSIGIIVPVKEDLLDAVTGLSGSGPAYCFLFLEALSDGGVKSGLPRYNM